MENLFTAKAAQNYLNLFRFNTVTIQRKMSHFMNVNM